MMSSSLLDVFKKIEKSENDLNQNKLLKALKTMFWLALVFSKKSKH